MNRRMGAEGLTAEHIINFLHNGSPGSREKGMVDFDWRDIFSVVDQALRLLSQYLEVRSALPLLRIILENILKHSRQCVESVATDKTVKSIRYLHLFQISSQY